MLKSSQPPLIARGGDFRKKIGGDKKEICIKKTAAFDMKCDSLNFSIKLINKACGGLVEHDYNVIVLIEN